MILVLGVVVAALVVAGILGAGGLLAGDRPAAGLPLLAAVGGLVIVVVGAVFVVGVGGGAGHEETDDPPASAPSPVRPAPAPAPSPRTPSPAEVGPVPTGLARLVVDAALPDRFSTFRVVDGLASESVLRVQAGGFEPFERGAVQQCVLELGRPTACASSSPVQFDDDGSADFQVLVSDTVSTGGCRVAQATCLVRVTGTSSRRQATGQTVFGDRMAPGRVVLEPARGVADGDTVEVAVSDFPGGVPATVVLCAPPDAYDAGRCEPSPAPANFTVAADGTGRARLTLHLAQFAPEGAGCGPRHPCGVAVVVGSGFVAAPPAELSFSLGPGASYDGRRLTTGLGVALLLAAVAAILARRTDWTKLREAGTPAVDRADLQLGASLDEVFGTDAQIDEADPVSW